MTWACPSTAVVIVTEINFTVMLLITSFFPADIGQLNTWVRTSFTKYSAVSNVQNSPLSRAGMISEASAVRKSAP